MSINQPQTGVDDSPEIPAELFDSERLRIATTLSHAVNGSPAAAQEFAKRGCPLSWRSVIWRRMLGVRVDDIDMMYYEQLKTHVLQHELLVDSLVYKDIKLTATNDDQYFVFEDYLYQVVCCSGVQLPVLTLLLCVDKTFFIFLSVYVCKLVVITHMPF